MRESKREILMLCEHWVRYYAKGGMCPEKVIEWTEALQTVMDAPELAFAPDNLFEREKIKGVYYE